MPSKLAIQLTDMLRAVIWISFAPPIDPVALTDNIVEAVQNGAPIRTR